MPQNQYKQQEILKRAETELLLGINKQLYEQGEISEKMYRMVAQNILEDLTNPR